MMTFCTLFDSKYLDKGLLLYRSLEACTKEFRLFIFCFDTTAYDILTSMELKHAVLLRESDIETPEVLAAKSNRTRAEYCWTCSSLIVDYVLDHYHTENCTFIDADLYFYKDPEILFRELGENEHMIITPHRFGRTLRERITAARYGNYCVEFNYFDQSEESRKALKWWKEQCLAWCYCRVEDGKYGDQKYLHHFSELFSGVHVLSNPGGGVAPWNLKQYDLVNADQDAIRLKETATGREFDLVFYHFQAIRFLPNHRVNIRSGTNNRRVKEQIYYPYLRRTLEVRRELARYGLSFDYSVVHTGSLIKGLYQKYIRPRLSANPSDMVDLTQL